MTIPMKEKLIGRVSHYFGNAGVAVLKLTATIKLGDRIKIQGGEVEFEQEITSMQVNHEEVKKAKKKDDVGLKVDAKVREGYRVYRVK
jgi:hypothetical protein